MWVGGGDSKDKASGQGREDLKLSKESFGIVLPR